MDIADIIDIAKGTCLSHSLFGIGYCEGVRDDGIGPSIVIDFVDHGRKELQTAFCAAKLERHLRPHLHDEVEALVKHGLVPSAIVAQNLAALRASGDEPKSFFRRIGKLPDEIAIDYKALAEETIAMESNRGKDFKVLVASMMRAARGQADPIQCLTSIRTALGTP